MNIFLAQSIQTQIELEELADAKRQIITPARSYTIIGIVQDGLIGSYNLTSPNMRVDWKTTMNIVSYTSLDDFSSFKKNIQYTGAEIFSMIIPKRINVSKGDGEKQVVIKNGVLEKGFITNDLLGAKRRDTLTQLIWDEYGIEQAKTFLNDTQRLINNFNLYNGFTVGVGDAAISKEVEHQISRLFETKELKIAHMVTELENNPDLMTNKLMANSIFGELNSVREDVSKIIIGNIKPDNNFHIMMSSGSKGSGTNLGQMAGCIGLQVFNGGLIPKNVNNRTLPYFFRDEDSSEALGLIKHSFISGMSFPEFFFHNMTGRQGLIDMSIKTAESGYIQRKLVKLLEDYMVKYDGTVRSSMNHIAQFIYGDSGAETTRQYEYKMKLLDQGDKAVADRHKFTPEQLSKAKISAKENDELYNNILYMRDNLRISQIKNKMEWKTLSIAFMLPVNLVRIIENNKNSQKLKMQKDKGELDAKYILEKINYIIDNRNTVLMTIRTDERSNSNNVKVKDDKIAKTALLAAMYDAMSPKRCLIEYELNKAQFDEIVKEIVSSFNKNMVEPGEMVGIIAAQSLGEPTTQLSTIGGCLVRLYKKGGEGYNGTIGYFIDNLLETNKTSVKIIKPKDKNNLESSVLKLNEEYYIPSVSKNEKVEWKQITEVSRHPANGKLIKVITRSGKTTTMTLSHSFLKRENNEIMPVKGSDLKVGNRIPITKLIPVISEPVQEIISEGVKINLDRDFGWLCGAYLADGSLNGNVIVITKMAEEFEIEMTRLSAKYGSKLTIRHKQGYIVNKGVVTKYDDRLYEGKDLMFNNKPIAKFLEKHFGTGSYNKGLSGFIYTTNSEFIKGLIGGYFDGDGSVQFDDANHQSIRAHSVCENFINDMCILVNYAGMHTVKLQEFKKEQINNQSKGVYHTIQIPTKYAQKYKNEIGMKMKDKAANLDKIIAYNNREDAFSKREDIDMIPGLGETISQISEKLVMDGHSRLYKRYTKKEAIGRETLGKFIKTFNDEIEVQSKNFTLTGKEYEKANADELERRRIKQENRKKSRSKNAGDDSDDDIVEDEIKEPVKEDIKEPIKEPIKESTKAKKTVVVKGKKPVQVKEIKQVQTTSGTVEYEDIKEISVDTVTTIPKLAPAKDVLKKLNLADQIDIKQKMKILTDAYNSDVVWDEIIKLEILDDPLEYVYDLTVPGLESFMVDTGILVHNTLNSFHHSGVAVMIATTQGVPRVKELLSLTKNLKTPQMIIYPTKEYMGSRDMANKIASYIEYTTIKDIRNKVEVFYDPDPYKKGGSIERDNANKIFTTKDTGKNSCQANATGLPFLIRIEFNREKLLEKEVTLVEIKSKICNTWERRHSDKLIKKEEKQVFDNVTHIALLGNTDYDAVPVIHIRFDMINFDITILNSFIDLLVDGFKLKGIPSITGITAIQEENTVSFDNEDHATENKKMYVTYTKGCNLYDIRYLNNVDINKTICNDVVAMYETFGIEAARAVLLREIFNAYDRAGSGVNYQHIAVLIDMMTFNGTLTSVDRHGMSKTDTGPLSRASFEKTVDILLTSAVFAESDNMSGVSSRIMAGLVIKGGTGYCDVMLDTDMIQNSEFTEDIGQKYVQTYTDIGKNNVIEDITGKEMEEDMFIP